MTKRILKTTIVVGTIILTLSLIMRFHPWFVVDGCLDSGGRWNNTEQQCEYQRKPYKLAALTKSQLPSTA